MSIKVSINPILVSIGPADVRWYGLMFTLGIIIVVVWTLVGAKKAGISREIIYTSALWAIPFGLIISHIVYVLDDLDYFVDHPSEIFSLEGFTIYGGEDLPEAHRGEAVRFTTSNRNEGRRQPK